MTSVIRTPAALVIGVVAVMTLQSALGLLLQSQYRDAAWIKAAWFGNDWVTLVVAVPAMTAAFVRARSGSTRWFLVWLGTLGYAAYNYGFYMFGAALNAFFACTSRRRSCRRWFSCRLLRGRISQRRRPAFQRALRFVRSAATSL